MPNKVILLLGILLSVYSGLLTASYLNLSKEYSDISGKYGNTLFERDLAQRELKQLKNTDNH